MVIAALAHGGPKPKKWKQKVTTVIRCQQKLERTATSGTKPVVITLSEARHEDDVDAEELYAVGSTHLKDHCHERTEPRRSSAVLNTTDRKLHHHYCHYYYDQQQQQQPLVLRRRHCRVFFKVGHLLRKGLNYSKKKK